MARVQFDNLSSCEPNYWARYTGGRHERLPQSFIRHAPSLIARIHASCTAYYLGGGSRSIVIVLTHPATWRVSPLPVNTKLRPVCDEQASESYVHVHLYTIRDCCKRIGAHEQTRARPMLKIYGPTSRLPYVQQIRPHTLTHDYPPSISEGQNAAQTIETSRRT